MTTAYAIGALMARRFFARPAVGASSQSYR